MEKTAEPQGRRLDRGRQAMIKTILWDVDGTLLSFHEAERAAIKACFARFDMGECTDEMVARYAKINASFWERLELGQLTKPQVLTGRFQAFFESEGIVCPDVEGFNREYQVRLGDTVCYNDDSYQLMKRLKGRVGQYAVTNGTLVAQERKLQRSGLGALFDDVFISDHVGYEKPNIGFFDYVFANIPPVEKQEVLIVGDSLTSDIRGGNNAGILCAWYNPQGLKNDKGVRVDFELRDLREVEGLI
jgi:2-haloacid dehalogenase